MSAAVIHHGGSQTLAESSSSKACPKFCWHSPGREARAHAVKDGFPQRLPGRERSSDGHIARARPQDIVSYWREEVVPIVCSLSVHERNTPSCPPLRLPPLPGSSPSS